MNRAEATIFAALSGSPTLGALVDARIYPDVAPQIKTPTEPTIIFERAATDPTYTIHGELIASRVTLAVSCYANTRLLAATVGDAVIAAMAPGHVSIDRSALLESDSGAYADVIVFDVWET